MIKAILVDDEPMTRSGLRRFIDWTGLGIEIVGEAEDGIEAYDLFIRVRPDMILCDIRMPRLDGIGLTQRIREIDSNCKIIFLSGYNDIDYLKSAIKLQAVDYMLKPIQMSELSDLLKKTVSRIWEDRQQQQQIQHMRQQLDRSKPELTAHSLKAILKLSVSTGTEYDNILEDIARIDDSFPMDGFYQCITFSFKNDQAEQQWKEESKAEAAVLELPILIGVIDGIGVACIGHTSRRNDDQLGMWLNRLTRRRGQEEQTGIAAGVGETFTHLNGYSTSYEQALRALSHQFYRGWNTVIWFRDLPQNSRTLCLFDKQAIIRFEELLRGKQMQAAEQWVDQTINELLLNPSSEVEAVRKKLFRWYVAMTRIYSETMWEFETDQLWATMFVSGELFLIRKFIMQRLEIIRQSLDLTDSSDKTVIRDIIRFIQGNYNKDVSITMVAGHVHLAPTYMCILFKKEKGLSINDYITQYRIEQAKLLLRDRRLKLYDVSAQVGYQDANYFAKVFRKLTGVIPSQYRDTLQEEC